MKTQSGTRRQGGKSGKARGGYTCRNLNDNAAAAASAARLLLYALLTEATRSGGSAGLAGLALCLLVVLANLADKVGECFVDVDALLRRRLDELAVEVLREITALCEAQAPSVSGTGTLCARARERRERAGSSVRNWTSEWGVERGPEAAVSHARSASPPWRAAAYALRLSTRREPAMLTIASAKLRREGGWGRG